MASSSLSSSWIPKSCRDQHLSSSSCKRVKTRVSCHSQSDEIPDTRIEMERVPSFCTGLSSNSCDWRSFRAALVSREQQQQEQQLISSSDFAHEIPIVEPGCVLVATSNLDRHALLQKSVVLVVDVSSDSCRGIILNKQITFSLLQDQDADGSTDTPVLQASSLAKLGCPSFLSGPPTLALHSRPEVNMLSFNKSLRGYRMVSNGVYLGDQAAFDSTLDSVQRGYVQPEEVRLCVGVKEWETSDLTAEIRAFNWWKIVSCSDSVLFSVSAASLWERLDNLCGKQSKVARS